MISEVQNTLQRHSSGLVNHLILYARRLWITAVLAVRHASTVLTRPMIWARQQLTLRRVVFGSVIALMIAAPTTLYLVEHSRHLQHRAAYRAMALANAAEEGFLRQSVRELLDQQERLTDLLLSSGHTVQTGNRVLVKVVATGYSSSIYETDSTPFITAANTRTRLGILALSRDLLDSYTPGAPFSFGDVVHVSGLGDFIVEDSMNARWDNRADVWFPSRMAALRFGVRDVYLTLEGKESGDLRAGYFSDGNALASRGGRL